MTDTKTLLGWVTVRVEDTCDGLLIHPDDAKEWNLRFDHHYHGHFLPDGRYRIAIPDTKNPAPQDHVAAAIAPENIEELRRSAVMIRRWIPETFPEDENGQIHFARAVIESVASTIERALGIPDGSADVTDHGSKSDLHPEYVTSEDGTDHGCKSTLHPGFVPPEGDR